ncbi:disulfide reductase [Methanocella sp. CWC-04]|uniref:CoB--CoM heterodisulfide reductase iron-sulfur subunit A n=1 Tax=Methanooceanicella nereidis TaxID=2052831 RepID=A0AAP2RAI8_9EURY|nr:FAD-dependent oxidoreductase [Methanocella sp. CWC-04]MCD1293929.1 disulfide reductase [Methanocella sp. CWC-04]
MKDPSIGVFICHCGDNISGTVNIEELKARVSAEGVRCVEDFPYLCSVAGQSLIKDRIKELGLDRVVVAACSPNVHEGTFKECVTDADLNPNFVDIANIREQCSWVSGDDPTGRAADIVRSSIFAMRQAKPLKEYHVDVEKSAMVIGGGIAGITAALSLAKHGIKVYLVEKNSSIGGNMVKIGKVFSPERLTEECAMCSLAPLMGEVSRNKNIEVLTLSKAVNIAGHAGDFRVTIEQGPVYVDPEICTSCGKCSRVCCVSVPDEWNAGLSKRTAIYRPFPQAVPTAYTIDDEACKKCGKCVKECGAGAIDLSREPVKRLLRVGAIVVATGHNELDPSEKYELGYKKYEGVITQMELARLLAVNGPTLGKLMLPVSEKVPQRIVMVQCVGSRDEKPGSLPYCSKICCMTALKHANFISDHFPGTEVYICYTDIRAPGTFENYYREVQKKGVKFVRGRVGEVIETPEKTLLVRVEDTLGNGPLEIEADMVVLSCALEPSEGTIETARALNIGLTQELFIKEKHPKLEPVSTTSRGVFVCGTAQGAKDVTDSIIQAKAAASMAAELVNGGTISIEPKFAVIDPEKCSGCGKCIELCPYNAPYKNGTIKIDPLSCIGLGGCISRCPEHAISMPSNSDEEIYARIDALLAGGPKILAFLDEMIAYVAADNIGTNRVPYPSSVRIIRLPSVMRLETKHLLYAFERGALGIFLGDGTVNASSGAIRANVAKRVNEHKEKAAALGIDPDRIFYYEAYLPHFRGMAKRMERFAHMLELKNINGTIQAGSQAVQNEAIPR